MDIGGRRALKVNIYYICLREFVWTVGLNSQSNFGASDGDGIY